VAITGGSASVTTLTISGNTINTLSSGYSLGTVRGIVLTAGATVNITSNPINSLSGAAALTGIEVAGGTAVTVSGHTIHTLTSTGSTAVGITAGGGTTVTVSNNTIRGLIATASVIGTNITAGTTVNLTGSKIYDLESSGGGGATGVNIQGSSGTVNVTNNLIGDLRTPITAAPSAINGISVAGNVSTTRNLSYNTIYLNATSTGANFGTSGVYHVSSTTATTNTLVMRNNIIVNVSTPNGGNQTVAFRRGNTTGLHLANYSTSSNNNLFYAGTPAANRLIYEDGNSTAQTIAAYKAGVFLAGTIAPRDAASVSENPPFLSLVGSSANFLHIDPTVATLVESGGLPIAGITTDFDGDTRNATTPDIGADEFVHPPCTGAPSAGTSSSTSASVCTGSTVTLSNNALNAFSDITYQWQVAGVPGGPYSDVSGGTGATTKNYTTGGLSAGVYYYILRLRCSNVSVPTGDSYSNEVMVTVNANPAVTIAPTPANSAICGAGNVSLLASGANTYVWTPATGLSNATIANPTATPAISTQYTVAGTDGNGCIGYATQTVTVAQAVTMGATTAAPSTVCYNGTSNLSTSATVASGYYLAFGGTSFTDISGTGTAVTGAGDDSEHNVTIPSFTFNGIAYTAIRIGSNGALVFGSTTGDIDFNNLALPAASFGTAGTIGLAPWWDDGDNDVTSNIYTQQIGNVFYIQWHQYGHYGPTVTAGENITYQVQLDLTNGSIYFVYPDVIYGGGQAANDNGASATVGLNFSAASALQYSFNAASLSNGTVLAFHISSIAGYSWSPATFLDNAALQNPTASNVTTTTAYTATATANSGCNATGNATVTMTPCAYYSRATGNVSDPIWSPVPSGSPGAGAATFTSSTDLIVQAGDVVTNTTASVQVRDLSVDAGGTLVLDANTLLNTNGNVLVNGTLTANDNSAMLMSSNAAQTATFASTTSFWDLTVDADVSCTVTGNVEVRGSLDLLDGNFDCTGNQVSLTSSATQTGRLGPVGATASYTGNMRIERYRPAGNTNWMLMGSPIQNRDVVHWQDDFITAGYPGSQYPSFAIPVGSNILWPSIRWYDETNTGANENDGLQGVISNTQALSTGQGFAVWAGTGLNNTNAFSIDLEGAPPVIASTPISLPLSFTDTGNPSADGWNLVSNPLPSPIDFEQIALGANVEDYITYYNPTNGNTAVYDISLGILLATNGATNTIQSMQGFFLKANGSAVTTTVEESDKVSGNGGGMFGLTGEPVPALRLSIASGINTFRDETVIAFHEGTPDLEASDVPKYVLAHDNAPQIATLAPNGTMIAINAYGSMANGVSIPVSVNAGVTGQYTITITEQGELGLTCISLEDLVTGTITPMNDGATYTFQLDAAADETVARFLIHATAPALLYAEDANCGGVADGQATIVAQGGPHDITWRNSAGDVLLVQNGISNGVATITGLEAGGYSVSVTTETCGTLVREFAINAPFVLEAQAFASNASCASTDDGSIDLMPLGGLAPYEFLWNDAAASTTEDLTAAPGSYAVTITDANGCTWTSDALLIGHDGPVASMLNTPFTALVNEPVQFSAADADASFFWSFGDGATSDVQNPMHAFELPGTYTVVLSVSNGDCSDVITADITIELSTSVTETAPAQHRAWAMPQGIVVEHAFGAQTNTRLELLDATGRVVIAQRMGAQRIVIPSDDLASGLWFVRLTSGSDQATLRVPLTR